MKSLIAALILLSFAVPALAGPTLILEEEFPTKGQAVDVTLSGVDDPTQISLKVIYRPNSATERKVFVGTFSESGTLAWKPQSPGITTLEAQDQAGKKVASKNVASKFPSTPVSGVVVMLLAGMLLFGGASYSLSRALKE
jgi:hypothetical protein